MNRHRLWIYISVHTYETIRAAHTTYASDVMPATIQHTCITAEMVQYIQQMELLNNIINATNAIHTACTTNSIGSIIIFISTTV